MHRCVAIACVFSVLAAAPALAQERKLNGALARAPVGKVTSVEPSPDGAWLVYLAQPTATTRTDLFSVPVAGGAALQLNPAQLATRVVQSFRIDPTSHWVVYRNNKDVSSRFDLYVVPVDRSLPAVRLNDPSAGNVSSYEISSDGQRVVFATSAALFTVPLTGGSPAQELDGELVSVTAGNFARFVLDRGLAFFFVNSGSDAHALCSVQIDASAPRKILTGPMFTGFAPTLDPHPYTVRITPDGLRAVYLGDHGISGTADLFSVPVDGSASPVGIHQDPSPYLEVSTDYLLTGDGRVLFTRANTVFVAPVDGSAPAAVLDTYPSGYLLELELAPDDSRLAFVSIRGSRAELRAGLLSPGSGTVLIADAASTQPQRRVRFSADGTRIVYEWSSVRSARSDGSQAPVAVSGALVIIPEQSDASLAYQLTADGSGVVFGAQAAGTTTTQVWAAPLDGSSAPFRVHEDLGPYGDASALRLVPGGKLAYLADQDRDDVVELYAVPLAPNSPAAPLNQPFGFGALVGQVDWSGLSPDGSQALYVASQDRAGVSELYAAPLRTEASARKLSGDLPDGFDVQLGSQFPSPAFTPDGSRVLYVIGASAASSRRLLSVPLDGHLPAVELDGESANPMGHPLVFGPGGGEVFFLAFDDITHLDEIRASPPDGSSPARVVAGGHCLDRFLLCADGQHLVYRDCGGLFAVPTAVGGSPVRLSPDPLFDAGEVDADFALTAGGSSVVFRCPVSSAQPELRSAPVDGSAPSRRINGTVALAVGSFVVSPDGTRVAFQGQVSSNRRELFVAPLEGSQPPLMLSPAQPAAGGDNAPSSYAFSPDGTRMAFVALAGRYLYSVPVERSSEPLRLAPSGGVTRHVLFSADGGTLVFLANQAPYNQPELFRVPVTGGAQVLLNDPARYGIDDGLMPPRLTSDGRWVVYPGVGDRLYVASTIGHRTTLTLCGPTMSEGVISFDLTSDDRSVIFRGQLGPKPELFQSGLPGAFKKSSPVH